jgi:hypothetical protein
LRACRSVVWDGHVSGGGSIVVVAIASRSNLRGVFGLEVSMRFPFLATFCLTLLFGATLSHAGQIWTDVNADGLPDPSTPYAVGPGSTLTFGLWFDAQSFVATNYLLYVEWTPGSASFERGTYLVYDCGQTPIDDFSHPNGVGFGATECPVSGVEHLVDFTLRIDNPVACCVTPIIDPYNPYYVFSQLGAGSAYMLFTSNPGTCFEAPTEPTEACCFGPWDDCADLSPADCSALLGYPQGPGTVCAATICPDLPPPRGACCLPDGECLGDYPQGECLLRGGVWYQATACSQVTCVTASQPSSWGRIKGLFH